MTTGTVMMKQIAKRTAICTTNQFCSRLAQLASLIRFVAVPATVVVLSVGSPIALKAQSPGGYQQPGFGQQFQNAAPLRPVAGNPRQNFATSPGQPDFRIAGQNRATQGNNTQGNTAVANGTIPSIPPGPATDLIGQDARNGNAEAEAAGSGFQVPGFVKKILAGGWLMLPLGICSLVVATLALERLIALRRGRVIPKPFVNRFTECVEDGVLSYEEATELCKEFDCPVSEVFRAALRRWGRPMFEIEQAVMDAGDRVSDSLRKYLRVFHAISNVAPLIGLLGTVIGMIAAFEVISDPASLGRPELLASGISSALMTTAGGLVVAIPAYLAYMYFSSKSDRYLGEIEKLCQRVIDCISEEGLESSGNTRTKKRKAA